MIGPVARRAPSLARRQLSTLPLPANSATAFRAKLASRPRGVSMHFAVTPSAVVTQAMASAGADAITIDLEHGPIDFKDAQAMVAAMQGTSCLPLVRVPSIEPCAVKRALDLGAEGIVFPLATTAADVERAVSTLHYPPAGQRGFGPFVASSCHGFEMTRAVSHYAANPPVSIVLIETVEAVDNIHEIVATGGVDVFQVSAWRPKPPSTPPARGAAHALFLAPCHRLHNSTCPPHSASRASGTTPPSSRRRRGWRLRCLGRTHVAPFLSLAGALPTAHANALGSDCVWSCLAC